MPSRRKSASGRLSSCPSSPKRSIRSVHFACTFQGSRSSHSKRGTESSFGSRKKNTSVWANPPPSFRFSFLRTHFKPTQNQELHTPNELPNREPPLPPRPTPPRPPPARISPSTP